MKEAVNDVFKLVEKSQDDILKRFDKSVEKVCEFHNVNKDDIEEYFDNEVNEQLGEK
jgi:Cdc6-like AAA superfamily ATPase